MIALTSLPHVEPTSVYRYYDANNLLLYVGITARGIARNREHNSSKEWWPFVVRQDVEHFPTRSEALERERKLIRQFRPPFNKQHNPSHGEMREIYLAAASVEVIQPTPADARRMLTALHHKLPLALVESSDCRSFFVSEPAHHPLASVVTWTGKVILRAPRKVGTLVGVEDMGAQRVFEFRGPRNIVGISDVRMHLKPRQGKPLVIQIHEVTGEAA